jgi:hypothetical protein
VRINGVRESAERRVWPRGSAEPAPPHSGTGHTPAASSIARASACAVTPARRYGQKPVYRLDTGNTASSAEEPMTFA